MIILPFNNWNEVCVAYDKYCKHEHDRMKGRPVFIMWLRETFPPEPFIEANEINNLSDKKEEQ